MIEILNWEKRYSHTQQGHLKSLRNLRLLQTCLAILYPRWIFPNGSSCLFYELSLNTINEYLVKQEQQTLRHYGDSLSDDSDSDDDKEISSHVQTPKKKNFQLREKISSPREFKEKTRQYTPRKSPKQPYAPFNAGLEGKLLAIVTRIREQKITTATTTIIRLNEIIKDIKSGPTTGPESAEDGKKLKGLRERARIPASDEEKAKIEAINSKIQALFDKQGDISLEETMEIISQSKIKLFVSQFRGINYMIDRWNADSRRYHRTIDEVGVKNDEKEKEDKESKYSEFSLLLKGLPQYSEMVLKTLPYCFYTELNSKNDFTQVPKYKTGLESIARNLRDFLSQLDRSGPCFDYTDEGRTKLYYFNGIGDRFQHRFSNGIEFHLTQLQGLRSLPDDTYWLNALPSAHNPSIATGNIPYHALKYSYGLKEYYPHPLLPRYSQRNRTNGELEIYAEYMHVGKFYVSLHDISETLEGQRIKRVSYLDRHGQVVILRDIANEKETSFLSFIPEGKVFYQFTIKYPSFKGVYKSIYQIKYGLNQSLYASFQYLLLISQPDSELRNTVIELLSEWLCAYHEVLLLEMAVERARELKGILVYLTHDNRLSFLPDKNLFTQSSKNAQLRLETHIRRVLRRTIARNHSFIKPTEILFHGFKLSNSQWVESQLLEFLKTPSLIQDIARDSANEAKQNLTSAILELTHRIIAADLTILRRNSGQILNPDRLEYKDEIGQLQNLLKQLSLEETIPVLPQTTIFPAPTLHWFTPAEGKSARFQEIPAQPNGNCLFESLYKGLQHIRPGALAALNINGFHFLRECIASNLNSLKDQKVIAGQTFKQLIIDQIADVITGKVDTTGYPNHLRDWLKDCARGYQNFGGDKATLDNFLNDNAFPAYVEAIAHNHAWGGLIEMQVISYLFKVKIVVYNETQKTPISVIGAMYQSSINLYHRDGGTHYHWLKSVAQNSQVGGLLSSPTIISNRQKPVVKDDAYLSPKKSFNYI